ncbi:hypothetical protein IV102_31960 [bacterium]|nr:hypothetical protein [bacterium]
MTDLPIEITFEVLHCFEKLGIDYMLVGSVASSMQGMARSTLDADVVVDLRPEHIIPLVSALESEFYVSQNAAEEALRRRSMFNVIQFSSGFKVDIYVLGLSPFDRQEFARRRLYHSQDWELWLASPEDLILSKLQWYRLGEHVSERQWRDALGLWQIHRDSLDVSYVERWAEELGISDLWLRLSNSNKPPSGSILRLQGGK